LLTTNIGAEGTGLKNGVHCIIEDNFYRQAEIIINCLKKKENYVKLIKAGREYVFDNYSKEHFNDKMLKLFDDPNFN